MIGYATLGTNDIEKARTFYDALLGEIGAKRAVDDEHITLWATSRTGLLGVIKPFNGEAATIGNGSMVAINVESAEIVANLHAKALALGGTDEGAPGPRGGGKSQFAYFRDLDGNKLAFYCMG